MEIINEIIILVVHVAVYWVISTTDPQRKESLSQLIVWIMVGGSMLLSIISLIITMVGVIGNLISVCRKSKSCCKCCRKRNKVTKLDESIEDDVTHDVTVKGRLYKDYDPNIGDIKVDEVEDEQSSSSNYYKEGKYAKNQLYSPREDRPMSPEFDPTGTWAYDRSRVD